METVTALFRSVEPFFLKWAVPFCAVSGFALSAALALRDLFDRRPRLRVRGFVDAGDGHPVVSVEVVNVGRVAVAVRRVGLVFADGTVHGEPSTIGSTRVAMPCALEPGSAIVQAFFLGFDEQYPADMAVVPGAETCAGKVFHGHRTRSFAAIRDDRRAVDARVRRRRRDCFHFWTRLRVRADAAGKPGKKQDEKAKRLK